MQRRYMLTIDSGGLRGIIPVVALMQLERTTGRLARDTFSFVSGTSTGALIAAAVAAGIPAERQLDFYLARSREVFSRRPWTPLQRIVTGSMYSTERLRAVIAQELGPASTWTLNDAPVDLLLTATRLADGAPWYFVRNQPANSGRTGHLPLLDCVTASAAAPTYFQPWTIPEPINPAHIDPRPIGALVDGAVGVAGNPVYQACVEAFYYTGSYAPEHTTIVSLGTGRFIDPTRPTWIGAWLEWLLGALLRSPGEQQTEIVQRHFPEALFYRLDPDLQALDPTLRGGIALDDVRRVEQLRAYGEQFATMIDWQAILDGASTPFRVQRDNTHYRDYSQPQRNAPDEPRNPPRLTP